MKIGKRKLVSAKSVWEKELKFSNWLASEPGLELIAQDLGILIENAKLESKPGNYPCDVTGNEVGDPDHIIVIENQFGKTDHDHLGKILTYATSHDALTGIWIAEIASDDHIKAVQRINEKYHGLSCYLVELSVIQIDDGPYAPILRIVCQPDLGDKIKRSGQSAAEKKLHAWRLDFWADIQAEIRKTNPPFNLQKPSTASWSSIAMGRSNIYLNMLLTPKNKSVGLELYINGLSWKESAYNDLLVQKSEIEAEVGNLEWMPLPDKRSARLLLEFKLDPIDPKNREMVVEWFVENTERMFNSLKPRVMALKQPEG